MLPLIASFFLLLNILAIHSSMAAMEATGYILVFLALLGLIRRKVSLKTPLTLPILLYSGVVMVSILLTPSTMPYADRLSDMTWVLFYFATFKCLEMSWTDRFERMLLTLWIIGLSAATAMGIYEFYMGYDFIRQTSIHLPQAGDYFRATGFFSLCLTFAYSMGISSLSVALPSRRFHKFMPFVTVTLGALCVYVSMTRGAWVALIGTFFILAGLFYKRISKKHIAIAFAALIAYGALLILPQRENSRISDLMAGHFDSSMNQRYKIWEGYFEMFKQHPFFGIGYNEGSSHLIQTYKSLGIQNGLVTHAHNDYLQNLSELGLIGLATYLFLWACSLRNAYHLSLLSKNWGTSLLAAQIFLCIGSLSQANFTDGEVSHILIFNWALTSFLLTRAKQLPKNIESLKIE